MLTSNNRAFYHEQIDELNKEFMKTRRVPLMPEGDDELVVTFGEVMHRCFV